MSASRLIAPLLDELELGLDKIERKFGVKIRDQRSNSRAV